MIMRTILGNHPNNMVRYGLMAVVIVLLLAVTLWIVAPGSQHFYLEFKAGMSA